MTTKRAPKPKYLTEAELEIAIERHKERLSEFWNGERAGMLKDAARLIPKSRHLRDILLGALLGGLVGMAMLAIINPEALRPSRANVPVAVASKSVTASSDLNAFHDMSVSVGTTAPAAQGFPSMTSHDTDAEIVLDKDCWLEVTGQSVIAGAIYPASKIGLVIPSQVRSGCPGAIHYFVGGKEVFPENLSKAPGKSEVVELK